MSAAIPVPQNGPSSGSPPAPPTTPPTTPAYPVDNPVESPPAAVVPPVRVVRKHPLAIRWCHWINFPALAIMVWSGLLILWAYPSYPTMRHAFPVPDRISVYRWGVGAVYGDTLDADNKPVPPQTRGRYDIATGFRLAEGMAWHFALAWVFIANGLAYVGYLLVSGQWRHLAPKRDSLREAWNVVLHDLRLRNEPLPPDKYNHAQRIAYSGVIALGAGMVITGLAIYKPAQLGWLIALLGGYQMARTEHFLITALIVLFFAVHVAQVIRAGWNNFRGMVTGYEVDRNGGRPA